MPSVGKRNKFLWWAGIFLAGLSALASPTFLPLPVLLLALYFNWRLPPARSAGLRLGLATLIGTFLLEFGAGLNNFVLNEAQPALFHPQLIPDLIISIGVYSAWWLVWWFLLRRFAFRTGEVFWLTGLYGVLIEQLGKVFIAGLQTFPLGLLMWLYVAVAYGSAMGLAHQLAGDAFTAQRRAWWKGLLAWAGLLVTTFATSILWGGLLDLLQFLPPEKLPMRSFPFW